LERGGDMMDQWKKVFDIREAEKQDLTGILKLYTQLHNNTMPEMKDDLMKLWKRILEDKDHHILVATLEGEIVSSCVLFIIHNLTHNQQPYALIENVITQEKCRNLGFATKLLDYAKDMAIKANCYKLMLMTGSRDENTLGFYEKAGYNRQDKTAFIQWI
jgi:ribosomal protein S18 acetylase RimI-like enzyme